MILKKLELSNFKMFESLSLNFNPGFNLILGDNGVGKTTILEAASVAISGFLAGMEDVPTRNIYKNDVYYEIVKDSNGIPNKLYSTRPTEVVSTISYADREYTWSRMKKDATGASRTTINPKDILQVSQLLVNSRDDKVFPLLSYQGASRHWISARSDANEKRRKQLHDRRCGYLGCMDRTVNMFMIYDWCKQMEWNTVKLKKIPKSYERFRNVISNFMSIMNEDRFSEVIFDLNVEKLLYIEDGEFKEIEDLSAGYQSILNLVIDLAYRMVVLNPDAAMDIREIEGVVLIDEIDSNLHPKWQWKIVDALTGTFPNVQFIAATHSPIIVSSCKNANIISINEKQEVRYIEDSYAFSVNEILKDMLGYYMRPAKIEDLIEEFEYGMDRDEYDKAKNALLNLKEILGEEHPKVVALSSEYASEAEE